MNHVSLIGRLTRDPEIRATQSGEQIAKYTLAVDRPTKNSEQTADFISCVAFGKAAEFAQRFLSKGVKIGIDGRIQTGSYTNKDGQKVFTTDVVIISHTFCEKVGSEKTSAPKQDADGFMNIPEGTDEALPF